MPRLKLHRFRAKPPPPDVLARYLRFYPGDQLYHRPESLPPISAASLFGVEAPIVLDVGCGRGEYLVGQAAERPAEYFVGLDWHAKSLWDAIHRARRAGVDNVRFVKADVRLALSRVPDSSVSEALVLFPPPRVERRRLKMDLLSEEMLAQLHRVLLPGAPLHFVTDHDEYFDLKRALIEAHGGFAIAGVEQQFEGGQTRFQQFWEERAIPSKRLEARKRGGGSVSGRAGLGSR